MRPRLRFAGNFRRVLLISSLGVSLPKRDGSGMVCSVSLSPNGTASIAMQQDEAFWDAPVRLHPIHGRRAGWRKTRTRGVEDFSVVLRHASLNWTTNGTAQKCRLCTRRSESSTASVMANPNHLPTTNFWLPSGQPKSPARTRYILCGEPDKVLCDTWARAVLLL